MSCTQTSALMLYTTVSMGSQEGGGGMVVVGWWWVMMEGAGWCWVVLGSAGWWVVGSHNCGISVTLGFMLLGKVWG